MKLASLKYEYTYAKENGANYGDYIQSIACEEMLEKCGFSITEITSVNRDTLGCSCGEKVICVMNGCFYTFPGTNMFPLSDEIIPFYFGFHATKEWGTRDYIQKNKSVLRQLRCFQPIGCRDRGTGAFLNKFGLSTFYSRCLTYTFPKRNEFPRDGKVFFVETPDELENYLPLNIRDKIVRATHWPCPLPESPLSGRFAQKYKLEARNMLQRYRDEAVLVVTSRFHCAVPCLAMGIPVIVVHEDPQNERMNSLKDFVPIYSHKDFTKIDWSPRAVDIESIKKEIEYKFRVHLKKILEQHSNAFSTETTIWTPGRWQLWWLRIVNFFKFKSKISHFLYMFDSLKIFSFKYEKRKIALVLFFFLPSVVRIKIKLFKVVWMDLSLGKYSAFEI